jgi:uncharacterized protein with PIN domain
MPPLFLADVHLGKLAKALRLLGFDTAYQHDLTKSALIKMAVTENRVLLSRNASLASNPFIQSFTVHNQDPDAQLREVLAHFPLKEQIAAFTRCLVCNELLQPVDKSKVTNQLPENTRLYFDDFWQCAHCMRVYWKGSHFERMEQLVQQIQQ